MNASEVQSSPLQWEIIGVTVRKDVMRKPTRMGLRMTKVWYIEKDRDEISLTLSVTMLDKSNPSPLDLGSVSIKAVYSLTGVERQGDALGLPEDLFIRIGQSVYDTARGVLLARSVGSILFAHPLPQVPSAAFLPDTMSGSISLN